MKIIPQSHEWITPLNRDVTMQRIERIARTCYQSEDAIKPGSDSKMVAMLCKNHHYAMVEHISLTIKFITDRGVANEIVRHRIGSYAQESTRYCNYSADKFENQCSFVEPPGLDETQRPLWEKACLDAEQSYFAMLKAGCSAQIARSVLPTCLKTELVMTANFRALLHFIELRGSKAAHPQIRPIAHEINRILAEYAPSIFSVGEKIPEL